MVIVLAQFILAQFHLHSSIFLRVDIAFSKTGEISQRADGRLTSLPPALTQATGV
jgi:hypothetical protein